MYNKYTKELLEAHIKDSSNWFEVCVKFNLRPLSGSQGHLKKRAVDYNIDFSHFLGKAWRRDREFPSEKVDTKEYLSNDKFVKSSSLRIRLIRDGYKKNMCELCGLSEWRGEQIPLELDHINSNHFDNSLENLQIICPNCHAQETLKRKKSNTASKEKKGFPKRRGVSKPSLRKVLRPPLETLIREVKKTGYCAVGRKYGVSDNCIRKWIKWESDGMVDNSVLETEVK